MTAAPPTSGLAWEQHPAQPNLGQLLTPCQNGCGAAQHCWALHRAPSSNKGAQGGSNSPSYRDSTDNAPTPVTAWAVIWLERDLKLLLITTSKAVRP